MNDQIQISEAQQNLIAALDYLLHLDRLRSRPVFRLSDHKLPFFHEQAFVGLPGVETNLIEGEEEVWLSIRRLQATPPPAPHDWLRPWVNIPNDPGKKPTILESLVINPEELPPLETLNQAQRQKEGTSTLAVGGEEPTDASLPVADDLAEIGEAAPEVITVSLEDVPEIRELFEEYVTGSWVLWSKTESARRRTIQKYDQFFSLMQDVDAGGSGEDGVEIAWGMGIALWSYEDKGDSILYPLISRTVELHLDPRTMSIHVMPTERDPGIHIDAFAALEIPQAADVEKRALQDFENSEKTLSPFDPPTFEGILRYAASQLDSHGVYWPEKRELENDRSLPPTSGHLQITDTWVVYARKRSTNFIAADIQRLKEVVGDTSELPAAAAMVVTEPSDQQVTRELRPYRGISSPGLGSMQTDTTETDIDDLFFAKPFNEEQVSIISRLDQSDGVVVQGPPGTGKTHTIANVICHYLALGRKVLVSAQHEAPLAVLQDQIPEALRPLTISLLTSERAGLKQLEQSVRKIAGEVNTLNEGELSREIQAESERIDRLHLQLASLDRELRQWASKQTAPTPFLDNKTLPEKLARYVIDQEESHRWFPDLLNGDEDTLPRFSEDDIEALRSARGELASDLIYLGKRLPKRDALPIPEDIVRLHRSLRELDTLNRQVFEIGNVPPLRKYTIEQFKLLEELRGLATKAHTVLQASTQHQWQRDARKLLSQTADTPLGQHLREWVKTVTVLEKKRQQFFGDALEIPVEAETHDAVHEAVNRLADGRRAFGWFGGDRDAKALVSAIRIGAAEPGSRDQWTRVREYLDTAKEAARLQIQWAQLRGEFEGPEIKGQGFAAIKPMADVARPLGNLWVYDTKIAGSLVQEAREVFADGIDFDRLKDSMEELERLREAIDAHLKHSQLKAVNKTRQAMEETLKPCAGPIVDKMKEFLGTRLGNDDVTAETVMDDWQALLDEHRRLEGLQGQLSAVEDITAAIEASGAPAWAKFLQTELSRDSEDPWLPTHWREAWEWARAKGYLEQIDGRKALRRLAEERAITEEGLQHSYLRVVELRTWRELKRNMTPKVGAALQAYLTAITRIGRGTGIRAVRYRRDARKAMSNAYGATPCWIMAHWRISESLPTELGMFDLLIIDEASQSDIWALPAIARAKKILIVGDDKQVSPSDIGLKETDIRALRDRFLTALPYGEHLLPGTSIYDLGSTMFASDVIRLREHFRCVQPIIEFSNKQFYDNEIKALRVPKPSERLDPPLIDVYVKGGYRASRKKINKPEADAIVEEIKHISEDPATTNRTIGVVSLLGADQAKYIQEKLLNELGEDVILRHNIRCGDAMHFQGKEADIVMISMVAADSIRADSGRMYEQRYNVASSRGRDRMYVFRSFERGELREGDLRARLLDHLENPLPIEPQKLLEQRDLCESEFEKEVYDELIKRGFRVQPQVRAGGYRLDLVVEGDRDRRLAIECDGDQYHGVDRWLEDLARQRVLERMGWRFWRCWASSWVANREECIADLVETLEKRGVSPAAVEDENKAGRSFFVEHRVVEPRQKEAMGDIDDSGGRSQQTSTQQTIDRSDSAKNIEQYGRGPEPVAVEGNDSKTTVSGSISQSEVGTEDQVAGPATTTPRTVDVDDTVTYVNVEDPENLLSVRIVHGNSNPNTGLVNEQTPLAEALLGAEENEVVEAHLPMGTTKFQILKVR